MIGRFSSECGSRRVTSDTLVNRLAADNVSVGCPNACMNGLGDEGLAPGISYSREMWTLNGHGLLKESVKFPIGNASPEAVNPGEIVNELVFYPQKSNSAARQRHERNDFPCRGRGLPDRRGGPWTIRQEEKGARLSVIR